MKDRTFYTGSNREAWNQAVQVHQRHLDGKLEKEFAKPGYSELDDVLTGVWDSIGLADKDVAHLCCNNGIELLSTVNLGAKSGMGFDISDVAIEQAKSLAQISGANAEFLRTDIYEIGSAYNNRFDIVMFTVGGLCWLPDLTTVFRLAHDMLRPSGRLVIYDLHPFTMMLAVPGEKLFSDPFRVEYSYFDNEPIEDNEGIDYIGHTTYDSATSYDFPHTLADIFTAIIAASFAIDRFEEFSHDIANLFSTVEPKAMVPLSYLLQGRKTT